MFGNHVTSLSSSYFNGELAPGEHGRVAEHLLACAKCHEEFEAIKSGIKIGEEIEIVTAPASIWAAIEAGLDQQRLPRASIWFLKPALITAVIIMAVTASLFLFRPNGNEAGGQWNVARLGGTPRIDTQTIGDAGKLRVGQWLETDATSRARIEVATIGNVEIDPNSRVRLLETNPEEHRLELQRGRLSAVISAPPKLFFVNTPSGVAEDLGCAYTLEVDDAGDSTLHVTLGWVALELSGRESTVPAGAACAMKRGLGPGTPYFEDATQAFKTALARFDFAGNQNERTPALASVLSEARPRDAMTLWYLLLRVDANNRAGVYDRMAELITPPQDVTRDGVLNLDPKMLESWRDQLSIRAEVPHEMVPGFWHRLWKHMLGRAHRVEGKR